MTEADSIGIVVELDAKKAELALDSMISKMDKLVKSITAFDISALSRQAKKLLDSFSKTDTKGLDGIDKSAKTAEESVNQLKKSTKGLGAVKMTFDASDYEKARSNLLSQFSGAGKGISVGGNLDRMEKQASKLQTELDKLLEKEQKVMAVGKTSPESSMFTNLQYDIANTKNKLAEVQKAIDSFRKSSSGADIKIIRTDNAVKSLEYFQKFLANFDKDIEKSENSLVKGNLLETPIKNLQTLLKQLQSTYPQAKDLILSYEEELKRVSALQASTVSKSGSLPKALAEPKFTKAESNIGKVSDSGWTKAPVAMNPSYIKNARAELEKYSSSLKNAGNQAVSFSGMSVPSFNKVTSSLKNMASGALNATKRMASFVIPTKTATKSTTGLTSSLKRLLAGYLSLRVVGGAIKKSIDISSDLTEVQNVVDVAFGKYKKSIEDFSKISVNEFGMSELTAKNIAGRFQSMGVAIGFSQKKMSDMSVDLTKLTADMASFYNVEQKDVAKSLESVFTGTTMPLRKYGLDLTNATLEEWSHKRGIDAKMKSMSQAEKTMLRYQYVMENTGAAQGDFARTANTWANQIRLLKQNFEILGGTIGGIAINAFKPFVKGLNTIMGQINEFAKMVSNALGKIFGWTYEEGGGATNPAEDLADGMGDVADETDKATKKQKEFNKQLHKFDELNNYTSSDKDKDKDTGGSGISDGGAGSYGSGAWKQTDSMLKKYESDIKTLEQLGKKIGESLTKAMNSIPWDSIYKKADKFGSGLASFLNGLISPELFSALGKTIAGALNTALHFLNSFGTTFNWTNFGNSIAAGINSFFKNFDFGLLADTFNTWANGILTALTTAVQGVDWKLVASQIATLISGIDAKGISWNLGKLVNSLANAFYTLVSNKETWTALGTKIADGINGFFQGMNDVDPKTGLTGFQALGKSISESISGIAGTITTALKGVDWESVGKAIGDFISSIDFKGIAISFIGLGQAVWKAVTDAISGDESGVLKVAAIIGGAFAGVKIIGAISSFTSLLSGIVGVATSVVAGISSISTTISTVIASISSFGTIVSTVLGISTAAVAGIAAGIAVGIAAIVDLWNTSKTFRTTVTDAFNKVKTSIVNAVGNIVSSLSGVGSAFVDLFKNIKDFYDNSPLKSVIALIASLVATLAGNIISSAINLIGIAFSSLVNIGKGAITIISGIVQTLTGLATFDSSKIVSGVKKIGSGLKTAFSGIITLIAGIGVNIMNGLLNGILSIAKKISSWFKEHVFTPVVSVFSNLWTGISGVFANVGSWFQEKFTTAKNGITTAWSGVKEFFSGIWTHILNKFKDVGGWFKTKFSNAWTNIKTAWSNVKTFFANVWTNVTSKFKDVGGWFKTKFSNAWKNIKSAFSLDSVSKFFGSAWKNVKDAFGNIADWFEDKFSTAWKKVKDVFSTGGKVFDGIKDGILNGLKTVINGLIKGINKVIKVPFDGINTALKKIKNISIAGKKPFRDLISTIDVPQIPALATGGFPEDGWFRASQGEIMGKFDNGKSVVANNMQIIKGITEGVKEGNSESVMLMRQEIAVLQRQNDLLLGILNKETGIKSSEVFNAVRNEDLSFYRRNGHGAFSY